MRSILLGRGSTIARNEDVGVGREGDCAVRIVFNQDADRHCLSMTKLRGCNTAMLGISDP